MELRNRPFVILSSLLVIISLAAFLSFPFSTDHTPVEYSSRHSDGFQAPKQNIWAELTEIEAAEVNDFILEEFADLNLTKHPKSARDNSIFVVETLKPNKTDAISYLYGDGPSPPERWAKAAIAQNLEDGPYMVYYVRTVTDRALRFIRDLY